MGGELDLLLGLIAGFDRSQEPDPGAYPFNLAEFIRFELSSDGGSAPTRVDTTATDWFAGQRSRGIHRILVAMPGVNTGGDMPDRLKAGFVNTMGWFLVGKGPQGERWTPLWRVGKPRRSGSADLADPVPRRVLTLRNRRRR